MYTLPRKLPQVAIGFQHGRNVIHHIMPTVFNELHNYTGNSTAQNSNNLYQVLFKIVTMIINSWNRDWMSNNQNKFYITGRWAWKCTILFWHAYSHVRSHILPLIPRHVVSQSKEICHPLLGLTMAHIWKLKHNALLKVLYLLMKCGYISCGWWGTGNNRMEWQKVLMGEIIHMMNSFCIVRA